MPKPHTFKHFRLRYIVDPNGNEGGNEGTPNNEGTPTPPTPAPPTPKPTPPATPPTETRTFSHEYVHELREEAKANRITASEAQRELEETRNKLAQAEQTIAQAEAERAEQARTQAVSEAAKELANPELLLDSAKFQAHIEQVNLSDPKALKASIEEFVEQNSSYALTPSIPTTSGETPGGGSLTGATSLEGAISAHLTSN